MEDWWIIVIFSRNNGDVLMWSKVLALRGHMIKYSGVRRHEVLNFSSNSEQKKKAHVYEDKENMRKINRG